MPETQDYCMYDDNKVKPNCPVQDTHAFWIGSRSECRKCPVYKDWQTAHAEELEQLRGEW